MGKSGPHINIHPFKRSTSKSLAGISFLSNLTTHINCFSRQPQPIRAPRVLTRLKAFSGQGGARLTLELAAYLFHSCYHINSNIL